MSALMHDAPVLKPQSATALPAARGPAIESKPIAGGELHIKLALTPGLITLIAAPVSVLLTMFVGWILLTTLAAPLYPREMVAAAIVSTLGGVLAALPLFLHMKKGAQAIARGAILGIAIRISSVLFGLLLALGPGWNLARMPVVYWVLAYYFPLLIVETAIVGWLSHKAHH